MHWNGDAPRLDTLQEVVRRLADQGYQPGVVFDANAGYKLTGRYMDDRPLARALGLPADRVLFAGFLVSPSSKRPVPRHADPTGPEPVTRASVAAASR